MLVATESVLATFASKTAGDGCDSDILILLGDVINLTAFVSRGQKMLRYFAYSQQYVRQLKALEDKFD